MKIQIKVIAETGKIELTIGDSSVQMSPEKAAVLISEMNSSIDYINSINEKDSIEGELMMGGGAFSKN